MEGRLPHIILVPGRHGGFRQGFAQIPGLAPGYSVDLPPAHRRPCLVAPHIDPPEDWPALDPSGLPPGRSEEHTSELQSLMRISYAVFCLKKQTQTTTTSQHNLHTMHRPYTA